MMFRRCPPGGGQGQKQIVEYLPCLVSNDHWIYHGPQNNDYLNVSEISWSFVDHHIRRLSRPKIYLN